MSKCNLYEYVANEKGNQNFGSFNRLKYDSCSYQKDLKESTSPLSYNLYEGKFENCDKCVFDKFYKKYDLVDVESELRNITRGNTRCPEFKYNPNCKKTPSCWNTFDNTVPVVFPAEVCPIVHNNIPKMKTPGYEVPNPLSCKK